MSGYRVELCVIESPDDLEREWVDLQERADCSFFQSWGWISTWLKQVANDLDSIVLKIWRGELLVGISLYVSKSLVRHHIVHTKSMYLNESPFDGRNMVIEYNGVLTDKNHKQAVYDETVKALLACHPEVDEFFFSGVSAENDSGFLLDGNHNNAEAKVLEESLTWFIELEDVEPDVSGFLKTLSKNRRAQIRRSIRVYEEDAPLRLELACDTDQALSFFDGLKELHTSRWELKGGLGSFANPRWEKMHRSLIRSRFDQGEVQLIRVCDGKGVIGYLYNFIWRNHVYVLQTGFKIEDDKRLMPGYVVHVLAIAHNRKIGMKTYDLLHGDTLYKRILCKKSHQLVWLVLQRKKVKFFVEDAAKNIVRQLRHKIKNR